MANHEKWIRESEQLARQAIVKGNMPFGALLVSDETVILTAQNSVITERDCTAHAELNLVRRAWSELTDVQRRNVTLYTSTEPCAMCAGAIYWAGIQKIVFGCSLEKFASVAGLSLEIESRKIFKTANREIEVIGPILEEELLKIHRDFWVKPLNT